MKPFDILRIGLVLLKVPFSLLYILCLNLANLVAPTWTFKMIQKRMMMKGISKPFESTSDFQFAFSTEMVKKMAENKIKDILKEAQCGSAAPNPTLLNLESKASISLLSLAKAGRPMVVNFGSCT
eukprot:TRINITY_DN8484_c0_g1_i3.p1 TRINITY_DN8484_c0_g1~~TRINITY_DN8484_c0_g1_i3.p1  ORF type:complete len:125 (-),score=25.25 TRINITY_DN8484_c0_g1_i3:494-868(-)